MLQSKKRRMFQSSQWTPGDKYTIILLGKKDALKRHIGNRILGNDEAFKNTLKECEQQVNSSTNVGVINTPDDLINDECPVANLQIVDCMAHSQPGPNLFLLVVEEGHATPKEIKRQVDQLKYTFGEDMTENMVIVLPDSHHCKAFNKESKLKFCTIYDVDKPMLKNFDQYWFKYDEFMSKRRSFLESKNKSQVKTGHPGHADQDSWQGPPLTNTENSRNGPRHQNPANHQSDPCNTVNIILLGQTGVGKSASGNTILGKHMFRSETRFEPVTRECQVEEKKMSNTGFRIIDTPDFFDEDVDESVRKGHIDFCRDLSQIGSNVYLLVIQVGRFTDGERKILYNLENRFGRDILKKVIVLFTHGEDLKSKSIGEFLEKADCGLQELVGVCGNRYHVFSNSIKDRQQVAVLLNIIFRLLGLALQERELTATDLLERGKDHSCMIM